MDTKRPSRNYQYFDIPIPDFLADWTDISWYDDITASSWKDLSQGSGLRVWVNTDDLDRRFWNDRLKYLVVLEDRKGEEIARLQADTDAECIKAIEELERKNPTLQAS